MGEPMLDEIDFSKTVATMRLSAGAVFGMVFFTGMAELL
jgi:hypothetical protein